MMFDKHSPNDNNITFDLDKWTPTITPTSTSGHFFQELLTPTTQGLCEAFINTVDHTNFVVPDYLITEDSNYQDHGMAEDYQEPFIPGDMGDSDLMSSDEDTVSSAGFESGHGGGGSAGKTSVLYKRRLPGPIPAMADEQLSPEQRRRRNRRRERNKMAAARCRQKRLEQTNILLEETKQLENEAAQLKSEIANLERAKQQLEFVLQSHQPLCQAHVSSGQKPYQPLQAHVPSGTRPFQSIQTQAHVSPGARTFQPVQASVSSGIKPFESLQTQTRASVKPAATSSQFSSQANMSFSSFDATPTRPAQLSLASSQLTGDSLDTPVFSHMGELIDGEYLPVGSTADVVSSYYHG